jgi:hypothetical protein
MYQVLAGIERLLQQAHRMGALDRLIAERDALADTLGVALTAAERQVLRAISEPTLRGLLHGLDGPDGALERPRPQMPWGRDRVTRGIRPRD